MTTININGKEYTPTDDIVSVCFVCNQEIKIYKRKLNTKHTILCKECWEKICKKMFIEFKYWVIDMEGTIERNEPIEDTVFIKGKFLKKLRSSQDGRFI